MDDFTTSLFVDVWKKLEGEIIDLKAFLDCLYQLESITHHQYDEISSLPTVDALKTIYGVLKAHPKGYEVLLNVIATDYQWLKEECEDLRLRETKFDEIFKQTLSFGSVPQKSAFYIDRNGKLEILRKALYDMKPHANDKILLHGMNGIGKTSLAAAALRDRQLLLQQFNNKVYWISLTNEDEVEILEQMYRLYRKIIISNQAELSDLPLDKPATISLVRDNFQVLFHKKTAYKKSLLIIDNITKSSTIAHFNNLGCHLLLIAEERLHHGRDKIVYVNLEHGFNEIETIRIFALALDCRFDERTVVRFNAQAQKVHHWCRGDPTLVTLCASLMEARRDSLRHGCEDNWREFLTMLSDKKMELANKRYETFKLCFNQLPNELREKYETFAIFPEETNITSKTLQIYWREAGGEKQQQHQYHIDETLERLVEKSLLVKTYNQQLKCYIYGIHHVFLNFLRDNLSADGLQSMHRRFLRAYKETYGGYAHLPNDNYIYQYLGYHLYRAGWLDEMRDEYFFDLRFVEVRLKVNGIADVLRDYDVYGNIVSDKDDNFKERLYDYIDFINIYGQSLQKYPHTDIVQCALQLCSDGEGVAASDSNAVRTAALKLVEECAEGLYFHWQAPHESNYYTHKLTLNEPFRVACFTNELNQILVGTTSGDIELWEQQYGQKLLTFRGHEDAITYLILRNDHFISLAGDGTVKIWSLLNERAVNNTITSFINHSTNDVELAIPSPRMKQQNHQIFFATTPTAINETCETLSMPDEKNDHITAMALSHPHDNDATHIYVENGHCDSDTTFHIVTGSANAKIALWLFKHRKASLIYNKHAPIGNERIDNIEFAHDNSLIFITCSTNIYIFNTENGDFLLKLYNNYENLTPIKRLIVLPSDGVHKLLAVFDRFIVQWRLTQQSNRTIEMQHNILLDLIAPCKFLCVKLSDCYLITAASDFKLKMLSFSDDDESTLELVDEFYDQNGEIICLDTTLNDDDQTLDILLTGHDKDYTIKLWHFFDQRSQQLNNDNTATLKNTKLVTVYDAIFPLASIPSVRQPIIARWNETQAKIEIFKSFNLISETPTLPSDCHVVKLLANHNGNEIYYALSNGQVFEFALKTRTMLKIICVSDGVDFMTHLPKINSLLVGGRNGALFIYYERIARKLKMHNYDNVAAFSLHSQQLLLVTKKSIMYWSLPKFDDCTILFSHNQQENFIAACVSRDDTLVCALTPKKVHIFKLQGGPEEDDDLMLKLREKFCCKSLKCAATQQDYVLTCCCFSSGNRFLAVGTTTGDVLIFKISDNTHLYNVLKLHQTRVERVLFSPNVMEDAILMSVAEQIAWWNLKHLPEQLEDRSSRRGSIKRKKPPNLQLNLNELSISPSSATSSFLSTNMSSLFASNWVSKKGRQENHAHLLAAIKFQGSHASFLKTSSDFSTFLTVDNQGHLNILEMIDNCEENCKLVNKTF